MFDDIRAANDRYAEVFDRGDMQPQARRHLALVTCIDTRMDPLAVLGLEPGDAKVLRNAGGRVTQDALRSLILATNLLEVDRVLVLHHTDCAVASPADELRSRVSDAVGRPTEGWDPCAVTDPDASLREDVAAVKDHPLIPDHVVVAGWRYDVKTGIAHEVIEPSSSR